ncbi:uncharacterized protein LOC119568656 [Penaeus monodon]|uniref:uncharacterized protein LOC119568656 n=1 Tax=Penaeus monodon TaxID=6687 RepID=UPI0018A7012D|nr:uncharacterized protein LOC119568656 [Penaeus monodon]
MPFPIGKDPSEAAALGPVLQRHRVVWASAALVAATPPTAPRILNNVIGLSSGRGTSVVSSDAPTGPHLEVSAREDDDDDSDWGEDEWPLEPPLPLPEWGASAPTSSSPASNTNYGFVARVTRVLHSPSTPTATTVSPTSSPLVRNT